MRLVLLLCALIILSALTFIPAEAQGSWTCTYDFSVSDQGWSTATYAAGSPYQASGTHNGSAWTTTDYTDPGYRFRSLNIGFSFSSTTITSVSMSYAITPGSYVPSSTGSYATLVVKAGATTLIGAVNGNVHPSSPATWSGSVASTTFGVMISPTIRNNGTNPTDGSASISSITLTGTGTQPSNCGGAPTPTPGPTSTPIIINTFATPTAIAIDAGGIYGALTDSNADVVNLPPSLINVGRPPVESGSQIFAYVKWIVSPSSADEIAGPFAPIISHTGIFLSLTFVMMTVYAIIWGVVWLLRFIVWIFKFIVMLVDLVLQVAQAIGGIIGGIIKFFL